MQNLDIRELLEKYKANTITSEELLVLESWYLQWQPEKIQVSAEELTDLKDEVWLAITGNPVRHKKLVLWPKVAAAVILLLFSLLYFFHPAKRPQVNQLAGHAILHEFKPGSKKAVLILSNGARIILKDAKNGLLAKQGAVKVSKLTDGELVYGKKEATHPSARLVYNTMSTPRGGQYNLTLSDGTKVWLNAASSITYPVLFSGNDRKVTVVGEAYFEVAHNKNKPFRVTTGNQEITVLGTHFNINGYAEDAQISTTLLAGAIKIKNLTSGKTKLMKPGQQARISKNVANINITAVDPEQAICWKKGYFLFDNQDVKSIMTILGRWYDVDVEYRHVTQHDRYGGTFSRSSDLSETLRNLEQVGGAHFIMQAKKVIVTD